MLEIKLEGLPEIKQKMRALTADMSTKSVRSAALAAGKILRDQAIANASLIDDLETEESIEKNIALKFNGRLFRKTGNPSYRIGVLGGARANLDEKAKAKTERRRARKGQKSLAELGEIAGRGKGNPGGDTFYWRFIEFGTKYHRARPFLRPIVDQAGKRALDAFMVTLQRSINGRYKKAMKKI